MWFMLLTSDSTIGIVECQHLRNLWSISMFGWFRKASQDRVLKKMDALVYLANLSTAYKIHSHLKSTINYQDEEELNQRMAIRTNYLFGKKLSDSHTHLDVKDEFNSGIGWLASDSLFRELICQSLRVMNTSRIAKGEDISILGEDILSIYGYLYPNEPSPDSYQSLVFKAIDSLEQNSRLAVLAKASKLGLP
jgi:hypothetical protein